MVFEDQQKKDEIDILVEMGQAEKSKEEDEALKQKAVTYVSFEELEDFKDDHLFNTNFDQFIKQDMQDRINDPEEWHAQFEGLDHLRKMSKFHKAKMVEWSAYFAPFLKASVDNLRSGISKDALMFTTEFLKDKGETTTESLVEFIKVVGPSILHKTVYEKAFISKEAKTSMMHAIATAPCSELLAFLLSDGCRCKNNNKSLMENSYTYVGEFFKQVGTSFVEPLASSEESDRKTLLLEVVRQLQVGIDSMPKIKKAATEALKLFKAKMDESKAIPFDKILH
mmetsp:Transcript_14508/g.22516  ORF Transcript_14508/g.22516 Transcript_14508/m.22516 type:complete len:282 (+) Transcript_14508:56-901(+)